MRDFADENVMNKQISQNINNRVMQDDALIIAGDFSFGGREKIILARQMINCKNIYLVLGNHDYGIIKYGLEDLFTCTWGSNNVSCIVKFDINGIRYVVSHYALRVWEDSHKGVRNLYSHSHGSLPDDPNALAFDIGMDAQGLVPLNFLEVEEIMVQKSYKPVDHHGQAPEEGR